MIRNEVEEYLAAIEDDSRRTECTTIMNLMTNITRDQPKIWSNGIVGFGSYHYKYDSGREGDWFLTGFSSRKKHLVVYITAGFEDYTHHMTSLGKYKTGKSCLYIQKLEDIDLGVLTELIKQSIHEMKQRHSK